MERLYIKLSGFLSTKRSTLDKIPLTELRRNAIRIYVCDIENPFEYVLAKGIVTGLILMLLSLVCSSVNEMSLMALVLILLLSVPTGVYLQFHETKKILVKNEREVTVVFSRLSSNCSMFLASGLSVRRAFAMSSETVEDGHVKRIVDKAVSDLNMNANIGEVFSEMNNRLRHPYVAEFISVLEQAEKYGVGSRADLDRLVKSSWQLRRDTASQSAREMETKLVFPSMLIFFGVMLMIAVGMLMQLGV